MMAGNPNWWSNIMHPPSLSFPTQYVLNGSSSSLPLNNNTTNSTSLPDHDRDLNQDPPQSWSQLLLGGMLAGEEERFGLGHFQPKRNPDNWEEQVLINSINSTSFSSSPRVLAHHDHHQHDVFKQEVNSQNGSLYGRVMQNHHEAENIVRVGASSARASPAANNWISSPSMMPSSSPRSCVTSLSSSNTNTNITTNNNNNNNNNNNILDFSYSNQADGKVNQAPDHSPECKSTTAAGACKKPRVQPSSSHPPLKVRKEKLGDRITALHQLVSPFGKTDTASVLLEAIGYIRFLQGQIEALSSPYLSSVSKNMRNQQSGRGERNSVFPEEPGQLLNEARLKRKVDPNLKEDSPHKAKDLRSRGLCLVPVSCTQQVGSDNGADYWAPAYGGDF